MILVTNEQMKSAERYTIKTHQELTEEILMERAGTALCLEAVKHIGLGNVLVVCGKGNNGGDGFVCAKRLIERGYFVTVVAADGVRSVAAEEKYKALAMQMHLNHQQRQERKKREDDMRDLESCAQSVQHKIKEWQKKSTEPIVTVGNAGKMSYDSQRLGDKKKAGFVALPIQEGNNLSMLTPRVVFVDDKETVATTPQEKVLRCLGGVRKLQVFPDFEALIKYETDTKEKFQFSVVVDCLFGTGYQPRTVQNEKSAKTWFDYVNDYKDKGAYIISADLPSGLTDDGVSIGGVRADKTVCFGYQKSATVLGDGLDVCGEVVVADIGIRLSKNASSNLFLVGRERVRDCLPVRNRNTHKGKYGKAAIIGGSSQYTGAAQLAISACVNAGAGYTTLYTDKDILPVYYLDPPEALYVGCDKEFCEADYKTALEKTAIGFGVGATNGEKTKKVLQYLLENYTGKLVIDADGLNALAELSDGEKLALLTDKKCEVILTPHLGEFNRLRRKKSADGIKNIIKVAKNFAKKYKVVLVLKSASTVVTDGVQTYISTAGNSGQAKGGSGDVLTGLMTGLLASGLTPLYGAVSAVYLAGASAEIACDRMGEPALTASEVIAHFGEAFSVIQR